MTVEIQEQTASFLASRGYTVAPVTIDNSEWIYGRAYQDAYNMGDEKLKQRIGRDYVRYMLEVVEFYEGQSQKIVGRQIPQVLLIHAYALNADWLDTLLLELEGRGYGGITWLHRWAITEGLDRSLFEGEPVPPAWIEEIP